ncbi:EAL domain-containing protein [Desulfurobacterium thermolithotrophum]|uniref:EAL domain-containing protein n=1 Tax=Desulfurobacterium thermolithotrophum TaxID=64160 RepID=UPI0013D1D341|nr:GGDEF domain-containing protein [Desulfurobacterium thermolithotrophum]
MNITFQEFLELYDLREEDLQEFSVLSNLLSKEEKETIGKRVRDFVFLYLPRSAKLLYDMNLKNAFSGTIEKFIDVSMLNSQLALTYSNALARIHRVNIDIPPDDFLKDYLVFLKNILDKVKIPTGKEKTFKKYIFFLTAIGFYIAITNIKETIEEIETDPITKLPLHTFLCSNFSELVKKRRTVVLLDLENFKEYNTIYGYRIGNTILSMIAEILKTFFEKDIILRFQNDEFFIFTDKSLLETRNVLQKIRKYLQENTLILADKNFPIEIRLDFTSILLRVENTEFPDPKYLLWILYNKLKDIEDKTFEKMHIVSFSEQEHYLEVFKTMLTILNVLDKNHVLLAVQPIVNLLSGETVFYEVLARIKTSNGIISPNSFINYVNDNSIEEKIDSIVIEKALSLLKENCFDKISINLSFNSLKNRFLWFLSRINDSKDLGEKIVIELVERRNPLHLKSIKDKIETFKKLKMQIFIDDYGTEYSNFSLLKNLEIDGLKIDGAIVSNLGKDIVDETFIKGTLEIAKFQKLSVVVEYLETKEQLKRSKELAKKLDYQDLLAQGYFFGGSVHRTV